MAARDLELPGQTDAFQSKSVLLSLISIFQTSIYFPHRPRRTKNSAKLIIKALPPSAFIFFPQLFCLLSRQPPPLRPSFPASPVGCELRADARSLGGGPLPQVHANSVHFLCKVVNLESKRRDAGELLGCGSHTGNWTFHLRPPCGQSAVSHESSGWNLNMKESRDSFNELSHARRHQGSWVASAWAAPFSMLNIKLA